ncbi:MAG: hypothetical protein ACLQMO_16395 [Acidobacteriaceae bacterium]
MIALSFVLVVAVSYAAPKIPDSAWQVGTLRSATSDTHSHLVGMYNNGHGMVGEHIRIIWHYTIDGGQYIYEAERTTRRHGKPLNVTINGPVKFAVVGTDLYLRDDAGKVHKLAIVTKTLKTDVGQR